MTADSTQLLLDDDIDAAQFLDGVRRLLLCGDAGLGKTALARDIASRAAARGIGVSCIHADPGSPAFGPPGAVALGHWINENWEFAAIEPLCSLDAARFRLPLVQAVLKLLPAVSQGLVLIDPPGIIRGMAGAEVLAALIQTTRADAVVALHRPEEPPPLAQELRIGFESIHSDRRTRRKAARCTNQSEVSHQGLECLSSNRPRHRINVEPSASVGCTAARRHTRRMGWSADRRWTGRLLERFRRSGRYPIR